MKSTKKLWLLAIAVTLLTLLLTLCASAETYSGSCGANANWSFDTETGVLKISGTGEMSSYGKTSMPWYDYRTQVKSIVIEDGITSVGTCAFSECTATTVTIADSVTKIGGYAFRYCKSITDIHIGSGVTFIGEFAINECKSLKSLTIPGNVKELQHHAINNCTALTSLTLEEGIEIIPYQAITGCKALTELEVPASAKTFGTEGNALSAVEKCTGLTKITFKSAGTAIYGTLPTATSITLYAPANSTAQAYADANKDDNVTFVALADEPSQSIGGTCGATAVWSFDPTTGVLKISGTGAMDAYGNTTMPWYNYRTQVKSIVIENGITSIGKRAFSECAATSVEIADSVTVINGYAFRICHNITDIKIGKGVLAINEYAFNELLSLESIVIPGNVKKINNLVFNNCKKLSSVTIEEGVETILNGAFNNCISLKEIILPSTLKSIGNIDGNSAFTKCTALEKVTFFSKDAAIYPDSEAGIPETATVHCYEGSLAEAYADKYGREKVTFEPPFANEKTTAFTLTAGALRAEAGKLLPIASLKRQSLTSTYDLDLLLVDENGALLVRTADGDTEALFNSNGEALLLADNTDIVIIYNDQNGKARFYVNRQYPLVGAELKPAVGIEIADEKLLSSFVFSEELVLADGVICDECKEIEDSPALFACFQTNENKTAIRIISGINSLYYDSIGFEISLYADDVLQGSKTESISTVFSSILNDSDRVNAEELGFSYLALAEIHNVNRGDYPDSSLVYFKIKPFSTIGGEKLYGIEKTITVTNENGENRFVNGIEAPFVPVVRFIATSDIHFTDTTSSNANRLKTVLGQLSELVLDESKNDGYNGLDAVILAGDIANDGTALQLDIAKNYLDDIIPEDMELIITMGNHDWNEWKTIGADVARKQFEAVFGDATKDTVINGYHFITICADAIPPATSRGYGWDYSEETIAEAEALIEAAIADTGHTKPVFVIQHVPNADTVAGSNSMHPCSSLEALHSRYPNLIVFAGHSHHPINDEFSISQKNYTTIGTGTLQVSHVHLVEVDEYGRVRFRKFSGINNDFLGDTWMVDIFDPRDFVYTNDRFDNDDLFFAEGAEINVDLVTFNGISFNFLPVPAESLSGRGYKIELKNSAGEIISTEFIEHNSYRNEDYTTPVSHSLTGLEPESEYQLSVYAVNPGVETKLNYEGAFISEPISLEFKTGKQPSENGGDLISLYISASAQSAANTAPSGLASTIKGTPAFSYDSSIDMDVVSFDGSNTQSIMHDFSSVASQIKDGFTVEAFFKVDEAPTKTVVAFGALQSSAFGLQINPDGRMSFIIHNNTEYIKVYSTESYIVGKYHHAVCVYDSTSKTASLYVDGKLCATADMADFKLHSTTSWHKLHIGADNNQNGGIETASKTTFAMFNLYSEPMSAEQVTAAYNGFKN